MVRLTPMTEIWIRPSGRIEIKICTPRVDPQLIEEYYQVSSYAFRPDEAMAALLSLDGVEEIEI